MWNRFWFLLSAVWMGLCWWMAWEEVPNPIDIFDRVAADEHPLAAFGHRAAENLVVIDFWLTLSLAGWLLWFAGCFVKYGRTFGFRKVLDVVNREDH